MKLRYPTRFQQTIQKIMTTFVVLVLFTCIPFLSVSAVQAPVVKNGNGVSLSTKDNITILSHTETIRWKANQPAVNSITVIKNKSATQKTILMLGMPKSPLKNMVVNTPVVLFNGEKQTVNTVKFIDKTSPSTKPTASPKPTQAPSKSSSSTTKPAATPTTTSSPPANWYTWTFTLEPDETVAYSCSYTITPAISADGTQTIKIPMKLLSNWPSPSQAAQITLEASFPYMIDPSPSISPSVINERGDLIWTFTSDTTLNDLSINIKNPDDIAFRYLATKNNNNEELDDLLSYYKGDRISLFQQKAQSMLSVVPANGNFNEIQYLLSQIDLKAGNNEKALKNLESLETKALFGDQSDWFHQKMLFDRYKIMKDLGRNITSLLASMKTSSPAMNTWVQDKIKSNGAVLPIQPGTIQTSKQSGTTPTATKKLIKFVTVWGIRIPVELFFLTPIIIIAILIYYFLTRNRKTNYNNQKNKRKKYFYR